MQQHKVCALVALVALVALLLFAAVGPAKKVKAEPQDDALEIGSTALVSAEGKPALKVNESMDVEDNAVVQNQVKVADDVKQEEDVVDLVDLLEGVVDPRPMCRPPVLFSCCTATK